MVRSDFEPIIDETDEIVTFPSVTAHSEHSTITHDEDYESSVHDRYIPPPLYNNYAFAIGANGMVLGLLTTVAGLLQIFGFPVLCSSGHDTIVFTRDTFYGFTIWCGVLLTISSATGVRSSITKRQSTLNRFLASHVLTTLFYLAAAIIMIVAFTCYNSLSGLDSCMVAGHAVSAAFICLGVVLQVIVICCTYETIFDGKTTTLLRCCIDAIANRCCPKEESDTSSGSSGGDGSTIYRKRINSW